MMGIYVNYLHTMMVNDFHSASQCRLYDDSSQCEDKHFLNFHVTVESLQAMISQKTFRGISRPTFRIVVCVTIENLNRWFISLTFLIQICPWEEAIQVPGPKSFKIDNARYNAVCGDFRFRLWWINYNIPKQDGVRNLSNSCHYVKKNMKKFD
jgi:hypothetical protein